MQNIEKESMNKSIDLQVRRNGIKILSLPLITHVILDILASISEFFHLQNGSTSQKWCED